MARTAHRLSSDERGEIIRRYRGGESGPALAKAFGVVKTTIFNVLRAQAAPRRPPTDNKRRHALNDVAFAEVTQESAYWAGFLMADGGVVDGAVVLALAERDRSHVDAFRYFLGSTHPVLPTGTAKHPAARLSVSSTRLVSDLARFGVVPRKTHTATVALLEHDWHFWRGVVDGDGWLGLMRGRHPSLHLHGSALLLEQFAAFVRRSCPGAKVVVKPHKTVFRVVLSGMQAATVIDVLYQSAPIALPRKAEKARSILAEWRSSARGRMFEPVAGELALLC
jgi:hypothetical protein